MSWGTSSSHDYSIKSLHSLEFFTCCFLFTKCYPGLARPNEFLIVRQRYRFLQTLWSHPSLNTLYKIIFFCFLESYLPLSILSFDMVKILSYSAFECPLYCQNSAWILNYTESNLELITISFGVWKNLNTYECFDSFVFILSHWKNAYRCYMNKNSTFLFAVFNL